MALPTFDFSRPEQTPDYSNIANLFSNYWKGYEQARTPRRLEQEELARTLQNKILGIHGDYLPGKYESEASKERAQTGLANTQNEWFPKTSQAALDLNEAHKGLYGAQTRESEAKVQDLFRKRQLIDAALKQAGINIDGHGSNQYNPFAQNNQRAVPGIQSNNQQNAIPGQGPVQQQGASPAVQAILANALGIDQPKPMLNNDNALVQPNLFGGAPTITQVGPSTLETKKGEAKIHANQKAIEKNNEALEKAQELDVAWDNLGQLTKNPRLKEVVGAVAGKTFTISPELRDLEGQLDATLGRIVLDTGKDIKGAWNERDQKMVDAFKPSKTDFDYRTFLGKYKASQLIQKTLKQRRELYNQYLYQEMDAPEAARLAEEQTNLSKLQPIIEKEYGEKRYFQMPNGQMIGVSVFDTDTLNKAKKQGKEVK